MLGKDWKWISLLQQSPRHHTLQSRLIGRYYWHLRLNCSSLLIQPFESDSELLENVHVKYSAIDDLDVSRRHLHYLWNTNMTTWLHHGNDPPQELNCLTSLGRRTSHIGNKTKLSSLSIDRQLKFKITAWPKLGNKAAENGNMSIKCTGSYFTAVKASSYHMYTFVLYVLMPRCRIMPMCTSYR